MAARRAAQQAAAHSSESGEVPCPLAVSDRLAQTRKCVGSTMPLAAAVQCSLLSLPHTKAVSACYCWILLLLKLNWAQAWFIPSQLPAMVLDAASCCTVHPGTPSTPAHLHAGWDLQCGASSMVSTGFYTCTCSLSFT